MGVFTTWMVLFFTTGVRAEREEDPVVEINAGEAAVAATRSAWLHALRRADKDADNFVTASEWTTLTTETMALRNRHAREVVAPSLVAAMDRDADGLVSKAELEGYSYRNAGAEDHVLAPEAAGDGARQALEQHDVDGDGRLSVKETVSYLHAGHAKTLATAVETHIKVLAAITSRHKHDDANAEATLALLGGLPADAMAEMANVAFAHIGMTKHYGSKTEL